MRYLFDILKQLFRKVQGGLSNFYFSYVKLHIFISFRMPCDILQFKQRGDSGQPRLIATMLTMMSEKPLGHQTLPNTCSYSA